ncbi:hypothetical protein NLU13_4819 [Sarocladium strictum]|uniref:Uncharacterized protein n=1 Tax=Sarocladium strictum TaxID=5046 RepID=A0AA39L8J7_SARSR|nr:hypothetical protein NLU13_4819 [Sarocladium strictum]
MSSPAQKGASAPAEGKEKKGIGKVLSRFKTVLRKGESSSAKRQSQPLSGSKTTAAASTSKTEPTPPKKTEQTPAERTAAARAKYEAMAGVTKLSKNQLLEERAKKLGERFGLELTSAEWQTTSPDETVLRMDKSIRMRVRRTCHKCSTTFTHAKECPNCQHVRCTKCVRHPPKRTEAELAASRERRAAIIKANKENAPIIPDWDDRPEKNVVLTRPSKTGGQDLVHRKPRQRVRRTCHECQTMFYTGNKTCDKCGHIRCTDCPRDPPKKDKYPFGYPGDEFGPSSIPHYECEKCKSLYPTNAAHGTECKSCGNPKSDASPRAKPRKVEPEPDPEVLKQIQAKLAALKVT